jgi:hypothetical protein
MVNAAHIVVRKSRPSTLDADLAPAGQLLAFVLSTGERRATAQPRVLCNKSNRSECVFLCTRRERSSSLYLCTRGQHQHRTITIKGSYTARAFIIALYIYLFATRVCLFFCNQTVITHTHKGQTRYYRLHITQPRIMLRHGLHSKFSHTHTHTHSPCISSVNEIINGGGGDSIRSFCHNNYMGDICLKIVCLF